MLNKTDAAYFIRRHLFFYAPLEYLSPCGNHIAICEKTERVQSGYLIVKRKPCNCCCYRVFVWCGKQDLNLHEVNPHKNLNLARLPIPPFPQKVEHVVDGDGFEPSKSVTADLQSAPFGHSGTHPCRRQTLKGKWSRRRDLNPQPADYKSAALPIELHRQDAQLQV